MTQPVVWIPEANEDLLEARAWYNNIRPQLGERFALAVTATVEAIAEHPVQFPVVYRSVGERECGASPTEYSLRCKSAGLWSSRVSMAGATQGVGKGGYRPVPGHRQPVLMTNGVLEVTEGLPRAFPVYADDHAASAEVRVGTQQSTRRHVSSWP